jgi:hypothetical protein
MDVTFPVAGLRLKTAYLSTGLTTSTIAFLYCQQKNAAEEIPQYPAQFQPVDPAADIMVCPQ